MQGLAELSQSGILVLSAKGLRDQDWLLAGKSDPYVLCRLGKVGSSWGEKQKDTETRSETAWDNLNPVWHHAFQYDLPAGEAPGTWELHLKVYDRDLITADDALGEVQIPLQKLAAHLNEIQEYALATTSGGSVMVMLGDRVEKALMEEVGRAMADSRSAGWFHPVRKVVNKFGQYFKSLSATPYYYANMVQLGAVWSMSVGKDSDPSAEWFRARSADPETGEDTYRWDGPEIANSTTLSGHEEVSSVLAGLGTRLGTSNGNGEVYKPNFLGFQLLNDRCWPEVPWHSIGLGAPQEAHAKLRPLLTKLCGPGGAWSMQWLSDQARHFFVGRESIVINEDLRVWATRILHKVFVDLELTEAEGAEFMAMQRRLVVLIGAPAQALELPAIRKGLDFEGTMAAKARWIERYKSLLQRRLPQDTDGMPNNDLTMLASGVMDALLFAGGQSVPTVLQYALALPYSKWGEDNLPAGFCLDDVSCHAGYLWEVVRRFAPVSGFAFTQRSWGSAPDHNFFLNLQMAQRDPRVWGPDAGDFRLRPVAEYCQKSVGFAEPAVAPALGSPNARACPAKDLAFAMCLAFMREFIRSAEDVIGRGCNVHKKVWQARAEAAEEGVHKALAPEDIAINMYGTSTFLLAKDAQAAMSTAPRSGMEVIEKLDEHERALVVQHVKRCNKFDETNTDTQILISVTQMLVVPGSLAASTRVGPPLAQTKFETWEVWKGPWRLHFITKEEDQVHTRLDAAAKAMVFAVMQGEKLLDKAEAACKLLWFDSAPEAMMSVDATFGRYLPAQYDTWTDMGSDTGTAELCVTGVGAWYLGNAKAAGEAGHEVPPGAALECNLEYMSKYETRSKWMRYGHTAYLGPARGDAAKMPKDLLGIWSCHHNQLFVPGDALWEHAKAGFRCSLVTSLTLRDHLAICHWIIANGLQCAVRESTPADHPLRRLMKQFYYGTALVNFKAKEILLPVDRLGFRTFGFSEDGWNAYFTDIFAEWSWVPLPEMIQGQVEVVHLLAIEGRNLPAEFLEHWPLVQDGLLLWRVFEKYVTDFLLVFYPSDDDLMKDAPIAAFWAYFEAHVPWKLPPLSFDALTSLLADLIWWVTAGHEFVGAIVEYLTSISGMVGKLVEGHVVPDVQSFAQALIVISLTGMKMPPLMDEWTHIFKVASWPAAQQQAALDIVRQFQADLEECANEIDHSNFLRERRGDRKFVTFNPRILESSVSI